MLILAGIDDGLWSKLIQHPRHPPECGRRNYNTLILSREMHFQFKIAMLSISIVFYHDGDTAECIQREMGLTETQFRLTKSRAKSRYADLVQKRLEPRTAGRWVPVLTA